jgi:aldehyde dehydrogenase (NAD+)
MRDYRKFYIDGQWVEPAAPKPLDVVNPATEGVAGVISLGSRADVDRAVAAAQRAFETYSRTTREERMALLGRIIEVYKRRMDDMAQAISEEMGAPIATVAKPLQAPSGLGHLMVALGVLKDFEFEKMQGTTKIVREPVGVCGLITPWNWPLYQVTAKVAPALAAGCTVVLKPSELSPYSALLFAEVMHDAGVPAGVFNLVNGNGETVGAALATHPEVDLVSITGSTRAGVLVAQAAAPTVKRVVQELGGKSPNLFLEDADFATGVAKGVLAAFRNVGQSCSAPTRMIVPAARLAEVEALAADAAAAIRVGDPRLESTTLGPIANAAQFERVQAMIAAGIDEGAKLVCGGLGRPAGLGRGFFTRPTIFSEVGPGMRIAREEIFGPVLSILAYRDEEEGIALANDTVYGLGAHLQSRDRERARAVASRIRAGQVHINYPAWDGHAPFGGYKRSGNGREYGVFGLEEFLETKAIVGYEAPSPA